MRTLLTLLLALAWMPLTAHCRLESLTGFAGVRCPVVETGVPAGDSHCDGNTCCAWESGQYRLPQGQPQVSAPACAVVVPVAMFVSEDSQAGAARPALADVPPRPPKPWQFCLRAALPVRAPSIPS